MQHKLEFTQLSLDVRGKLGSYFSTSSLANFALASKNCWTLFQPQVYERKVCKKFLIYVEQGNTLEVEAMLTKEFHLIAKKGRVTDYSGRIFEDISGFEYALWALDKLMWTTMLGCLPKNEASKAVRTQLLSQYEQVKTVGVTYSLNGEKFTENHFDFENTIKVLQDQVDSLNTQGNQDRDAVKEQWREGAGAQKFLPMYIVYECCSSFVPRTWFANDFISAIDFLICKPDTSLRLQLNWQGPRGANVSYDSLLELANITTLCKASIEDLNTLGSQLEEQMAVDDNQSKVSQI